MAAISGRMPERSADSVNLEYRFGDVETDCCNRLHTWLLQIVGALTAPTFMALTCRWRSRPQHQKRTWRQIRAMSTFLKYRIWPFAFAVRGDALSQTETPADFRGLRALNFVARIGEGTATFLASPSAMRNRMNNQDRSNS